MTPLHDIADEATDAASRVLIWLGSLSAAFFAFVETYYNAIGIVLSAIGVIGGLALSYWHKRKMQRYEEIKIDNQRIYGGDDA